MWQGFQKEKRLMDSQKFDKAIENIDHVIENSQKVITKYHELHLSLLAEKIKRADRFYLARAKSKDIKPFMMEWKDVFVKAFGKSPHWYNVGQISMNIENFWLDQRTIWNKAHGKEWNNNRDPDGRLMEYKR